MVTRAIINQQINMFVTSLKSHAVLVNMGFCIPEHRACVVEALKKANLQKAKGECSNSKYKDWRHTVCYILN